MKLTCKREGNGIKNMTAKMKKLKKAMENIDLDEYGKMGVEYLKDATPVDTGKTRNSWSYKIEKDNNGIRRLIFENSNTTSYGYSIVLLIRYGHAFKDGSWCPPNDFVSPVSEKVTTELVDRINKELDKI
jgi:hypothetical protein